MGIILVKEIRIIGVLLHANPSAHALCLASTIPKDVVLILLSLLFRLCYERYVHE